MGRVNRYVTLDMFEHARTARAIRVSPDGDDVKAVWLPLSQAAVTEKRPCAPLPGQVEVELPEWLAIKNGLV